MSATHSSLLSPHDLQVLGAIVCMQLSARLPERARTLVIRAWALAAYRLSHYKRARSERALSLALGPGASPEVRRRIVVESFVGFWEEQFSICPTRGERAALGTADIQGLEHLQGALRAGRGAILWESLLGKRTLAKQILHDRGFPVHQVHIDDHVGGFGAGPQPDTWLRRHVLQPFFERGERKFVADIVYWPRSGDLSFTRVLRERLGQNAILCTAAEGHLGQKQVTLLFLGQPQLFATGIVSLARVTGAALLPIFCLAGRDGRPRLTIEPPLPVAAQAGREMALEGVLAQYASLLESYIRLYPGSYRGWNYVGLAHDLQRWRALRDGQAVPA